MKQSRNQIEKFYQKKETVLSYEKMRFGSVGGCLVRKIEVEKLVSLLPLNLKKILDLGAGTGRVTKKLLKMGKEVFALDSSEEMVKRLKMIHSKNLRVAKGSAFSLPFKKNQFDAIISLRVFDHFNLLDTGKVLSQAGKVLKRGGVLVLNTLNKSSLESFLPDVFSKRKFANFYYSTEFLKEYIKKRGWRVEKIDRFFLIPRGFYLHSPFFLPNIFFKIDQFLSKTPLNVFSACIFWRLRKK